MRDVPYGYCHCGCGGKTTISKYTALRDNRVKGEPVTFIKGHFGIKSPVDYIVDENGCWVWQKAMSADGYGRYSEPGKKLRSSHRVYYEQSKGPIPDGMHIDHLCRNTKCVNPSHLEAVTPAVNTRRQPCIKLSEEKIVEIFDLLKAGFKQKEIAKMYNMDQSMISLIKNNKRWRGVMA